MEKREYWESKSATILWGIKLLTGIISLVSVCYVFKAIYPMIREIQNMDASYKEVVNEFWIELLQSFRFDFEKVIFKGVFWTVVDYMIMIYVIFYPIIIIIEALAATFVRFKQKGVSVLKITQLLGTLAWLYWFGVTLSVIYQINFVYPDIFLPTTRLLSTVGLSSFAIFSLFKFCYHKDIVRALAAVQINIQGREIQMKKTHLSGISLLIGTVFALCFVITASGIFSARENEGIVWWGIISAITALHAIKMYVVVGCNRQMKRYNRCI